MVIERADGLLVFRVYLPDAGDVQILGDFTDWRIAPIPMRPLPGGWWEAQTALSPGDYLFNYLVDGERWLPDYAAHGIQANRFGGWVSQLTVHDAPVRLAA